MTDEHRGNIMIYSIAFTTCELWLRIQYKAEWNVFATPGLWKKVSTNYLRSSEEKNNFIYSLFDYNIKNKYSLIYYFFPSDN